MTLARLPPESMATPLLAAPTPNPPPLLPTVVVAANKGGAWKTALAVALAERLAWAGQRVLLLSTEPREEARARLGVRHSDPPIASKAIGPSGSVTVMGLHASRAVALLFRVGAVETLATLAYSRIPGAGVWTQPPPVTEPVYVPGWGEAP